MAGLTVTVLGCSGSYPGPDRACSSYLLRGGGVTVWLDAGSGSMAHLQRHVRLEDVDAIVLSHEHPDHWRDVEGFVIACRFGLDRHGVPIYGPAGLPRLAYHAFEPNLEWHDVADGDVIGIGGQTFRFSRTDHPVETLAVRVDCDGRSLAYSADTGVGWSFDALGPGINLALCEATFSREQEDTFQHLSARQAGAMARAAGVERLALTHFWPTLDLEAARLDGAEAFGAPVLIAAQHEEYEV